MSDPVVRLVSGAYERMIAHALDGLPDEACGLLVGAPGSLDVVRFEPCTNAAASSKVYSIAEDDLDRVATDAIGEGLDVLGTMHSHTHTEAYPSPTDQNMALPWWTYIIVSLRRPEPALRAFRMEGDGVVELAVELLERLD